MADSKIEYLDALEHLMEWGLKNDGGGGRVCAAVLLSLYNSYSYPLNVTDLALLDGNNHPFAIAAIDGRARAFEEPHNQIVDGHARFEKLKELWPELHSDVRFAD
jgi:hypothetical protein